MASRVAGVCSVIWFPWTGSSAEVSSEGRRFSRITMYQGGTAGLLPCSRPSVESWELEVCFQSALVG